MRRYNFKYDLYKVIVNCLFALTLLIYFCILTFLLKKIICSSLCLIAAVICLIYLFFEIIPRKIYFENDYLYLKVLNISKKIYLKDVLWYSKKIPNEYHLFCKSFDNLCIFYKGKKEFISVKQNNELVDLLIKEKIPLSDENELLKHRWIDFLFNLIPCFIIIMNSYLINLGLIKYRQILFACYSFLFLLYLFKCFFWIREQRMNANRKKVIKNEWKK